MTSSYFEGRTCPLAALGQNRDGKKGKLQVNCGLITNRKGIPVAVSIFEGNTGDPKTLMPQVDKMQDAFGIDQFAMVGDRGMLIQKQIDASGQSNVKISSWLGSCLEPSSQGMCRINVMARRAGEAGAEGSGPHAISPRQAKARSGRSRKLAALKQCGPYVLRCA